MALLAGSVDLVRDQPGLVGEAVASGFGLNPEAEFTQFGLGTSGSRAGTVRVYGPFVEG
jgi:hypothetical protein